MDINGRTAIVTGAASGIGQATALALAAAGAYVLLADIDEPGARLTHDRIEAAGGRGAVVRTDVTLEADVDALFEAARAAPGPLGIVVNNAGVVEALDTQRMRFPNVDPDRWSHMLDINLRGVILGTQKAIGAMRHGGAIVNVASGAGVGLSPHDAPVYAASKAAVVRFTAALGALADTDGIRVNCICPGWVDTPMSRRGRAERTPDGMGPHRAGDDAPARGGRRASSSGSSATIRSPVASSCTTRARRRGCYPLPPTAASSRRLEAPLGQFPISGRSGCRPQPPPPRLVSVLFVTT